jgi:hypothetical protein
VRRDVLSNILKEFGASMKLVRLNKMCLNEGPGKPLGTETEWDTSDMLLSHHQNVGQNWDIKIANRLFENVSQFKYLGMTVRNQNLIQEEIKGRLNSGSARYHLVQNLLSSRLLSKKIKIRIYKIIILPVIPYGCETWSLILREEYRLRMFENRMLRIFGRRGLK